MLFVILYSCDSPQSDRESVEDLTELQRINRAIETDPADAENFVLRAQIHRDSGNYGDAIVDMAEAMRRDSVNEQYHHILADLYMESAKSQYAIGTMERSAMLFPDSIRTWIKMAELNLIVRKYDRAAAALKEAMTLDPQSTDALHLLGIMYREQDNTERAIQTYQTIVELDSEDAEAWIALGNLFDIQGDSRALQCFENAISATPSSAQALHSKAFYLQNHNRIPEAVELYKRIHEVDSTYAEAWLNRGILYIELDSTAAALDCFEQVVRIDSNAALGWYYAGIAAQTLGDTGTARNHYNRALELAPGSPRVVESLESLD
jgi:tetratricopeptide (TPR) repeat protein